MGIGRTNAVTGGSGTFDLVKVTAYTPAESAFSAPSQVVVSGLTTMDQYGEETDVSMYNGTYAVTSATQRESTLKNRIYSMTNSGTTYYLYYYGSGESYENGWCLSTSTSYGAYSATLYNQSLDQLSSGTETWYNEMGGSASVTLAVTTTSYPAVTQVLQGVKATDYVPSTKTWTFSSSTSNFAGFEKTPELRHVYAAKNTALIGSAVDMILPDALFHYLPSSSANDLVNGIVPATTGNVAISGGALVCSGGYLTFATQSGYGLDFGTGDFAVMIDFSAGSSQPSYPTIMSNSRTWGEGIFNPRTQSSTFGLFWNPGDPLTTAGTVTANTRYKWIIQRKNGSVTMWVDDVKIQTISSSNTANFHSQDGRILIGAGPVSTNGSNVYFYGNIYEVRIMGAAAY